MQSYAHLNTRPSVSFAEHSADSPLPVQAFISQVEFTEDENLRVISTSEADHGQLGRVAYLISHSGGPNMDRFIVLDQIVFFGGLMG